MSTAEVQQVVSKSIKVGPIDSRCRWWSKIIRAGQPLPIPDDVDGANCVPGKYLAEGEEELFLGDVQICGEANHHRRHDRGWTYYIRVIGEDGTLWKLRPDAAVKAAMKKAGLPPEMLRGSGDVAACVRTIHGIRLGMLPLILKALD